ncbi:ferritin-like domain-containing protein [Baekduia soli]|uniref:Ferritin-like domain-containing protein n=1 Tax=Baekduia soli TaxID=496014 RepID=A0A5B8U1D9_9ACTN|nr:ferritin-like domain-containing protein [Baekduia soli]QEC46752.1 ferritin-like domain-containing protein [Baekduia soli]
MTNIRIEDLDPSGDLRQSADDAGAWDPTGTRRNLLRQAGIGGAAVFGVGALLSPLDAFASASASQKGEYSTSGSRSIRRGRPNANDVKIGNYALTLEYLEAAFYAAADKAGYPDADIAAAAKTLAAHEAAHVAALKKVLGKAAVKAPTVNLDTVGKLLADQNTFIKTAASIEPVGTAAYAGAGPYLNNLAIVKAALSIHSVEANHAAYTAALVKFKGIDPSIDPIPNSFNPAYSFKKTVKIVSGLNIVTGRLQP